LTCREILFDKTWANLVVRWPVVLWLGSIWFVGWLGGGVRLEMFPVLVVFWGLYAWATSAIGLWASLFARSAQQATMMAVVLTIIFMGGHLLITGPCCLYPTSELLVGFVFGVTPPVVLGTLPMMEYAELNRYLSASFTLLPFLILGLMIWFALGCSYWESALTLFEQQTHRRAK
jgi:hypothetical protein